MSIFRSLLAYAPAVALPRMVSLLLMLLLTRLMSRAEYGQFVLVVTLGEAIDLFCCNWVRIAYMRFASAAQGDIGRESVRSGLMQAGAFAAALGVTAAVAFTLHAQRAPDLAIAVALYIAANTIQRIPNMVMTIRGDRNGLLKMELSRALGILCLGLVAASIFDSFFLQVLASSVATAAAGLWGCRRSLAGIDWRSGPLVPTKDYLSYGLILIPGAMVAAAIVAMDRLLLERLEGAEMLAIYAASVMLARQPLDFLFGLAGTRTFAMLIEDYETKGEEAARLRLAELVSSVTFLTLPAAVGLALVAEPFANLLLAPEYRSGAVMLIPLVVVTALCAGYKTFIFEQIFHMVKRNSLDLLVSVPSMIAGAGAIYVLTRSFGLWGCALGTLGLTAMLLALSMVVTHRLFRFRLPLDDLWRIALACILMAAAVLALKPTLVQAPDLVRLIALSVSGASVYAVASLLLRPSPMLELLPRRMLRAKAN